MKHWQEDGIRLGGGLLDENEAKRLVKELKKKIKDPSILEEIEEFLAGTLKELSPRARDVLYLTTVGLVMMSRKK
jgi:hypothetical protein